MTRVYHRLLLDADREGIHLVMIPLLPYDMDIDRVDEYLHTCLNVMVQRLHRSRFIQEIHLVGARHWKAIDQWMMTKSIGRSWINTIATGEPWQNVEMTAYERFGHLMELIRFDISRKALRLKPGSNDVQNSEIWKFSQGIYRVSKTRYLLLGQVMPYLLSLWSANMLGPQLARPNIQHEEVVPNTMHSMQESRIPPKRGRYTRVRWNRLLLMDLMNVRPGGKLYKVRPRMAGIEEPEFEAEMATDSNIPIEKQYNEYWEQIADQSWLYVSERTQRVMHGMCMLELKLCNMVNTVTMDQRIKGSEMYCFLYRMTYIRTFIGAQRWIKVIRSCKRYHQCKRGRMALSGADVAGSTQSWVRLAAGLWFVFTIRRMRWDPARIRRRWRGVVYREVKEKFQQLPQSIIQGSDSAWVRTKPAIQNESWRRYVTQCPWARVVPLIISLARWSHIEYLVKDDTETPLYSPTMEKESLEANDSRWERWGSKLEAKENWKLTDRGLECLIYTNEEVRSWWKGLTAGSQVHYLLHVMYGRLDYGREWYYQEETRLKWYLGHLDGPSDTKNPVCTLFHSRRVKRHCLELNQKQVMSAESGCLVRRERKWEAMASGGSCIPLSVASGKTVEDATAAVLLHYDRLAYLPLGKDKENEPSRYTVGRHIVRVSNESWCPSAGRREVNAHPTDIWQLSLLFGSHYMRMKFGKDYEPVDGKYVGKNTLASTGINTAMLAPKSMGPFICEQATVSGGGDFLPVDWHQSCQQMERQRYRQLQRNSRDTKQGIPVAKEYKDGDKLHSGKLGRLNFAPANTGGNSFICEHKR